MNHHHAKREAKRLYELSLKEGGLKLPNLSSAKEIVAKMKGYYSWHDYEKNMQKEEASYNTQSYNTQSYTPQDANLKLDSTLSGGSLCPDKNNIVQEFVCHSKIKPKFPKFFHPVAKKVHTKVKLGLTDKGEVELNSYPLSLVGNYNAGRTSILNGLIGQYIKNGEGVIFIDEGNPVFYDNLFTRCSKAERLSDLYCTSFFSGAAHSFDPINPLIGNKKSFLILYGEIVGELIHEIAKDAQQKDLLIDADNIDAMMNIHNLFNWQKNNTFPLATKLIEKYLYEFLAIDRSVVTEFSKASLCKHEAACMIAKNTTKVIKIYEKDEVFSKNPHVSFTSIINESKIWLLAMPSDDKAGEEFKEQLSIIKKIIILNLHEAVIQAEENKIFSAEHHFQNIILNLTLDNLPNNISYVVNNFSPCVNWIFGFSRWNNVSEEGVKYAALKNSNSYIFMKTEGHQKVPDFVVGKIFNHIEKAPNLFVKKGALLNSLSFCQGYIFQTQVKDNEVSSDFSFLNFSFNKIEPMKGITLQRGDFRNNVYEDFSLKDFLNNALLKKDKDL